MKIVIMSPSKAFFRADPDELSRLNKQLSYTNTAASQQVKRHYDNFWLRRSNKEAWEAKLAELNSYVHNTLIFEERGVKYIRPGSIPYLKAMEIQVDDRRVFAAPKAIAWEKPLPFTLHPYQEESWQRLLEIKHGNVELCTGAGKSVILLKVCRESGFRTAIVAPSESVFSELLEKFEYHFGKSQVGTFGDGKKKLGKRFTICIGKSLANVEPGTPEWDFFSNLDMLCVDESHTWGADTLETICHGVLSTVPYRLFFSGTQTRNDGAKKLLQSIIGKTVCTLTTDEAVAKGYICKHSYRIIEVESSDPNVSSSDPIEMKRIHFLDNKNILAFIARLANFDATTRRRQTLILVEELDQIVALLRLLKVPTAVAHSTTDKKKLAKFGLQKVKKADSIRKFNRNEVQVLIGTSCVSTGTNIYPTHNTVNWQGGNSEIKTKQGAVGRSVRLHDHNPWKDLCTYKDEAIIYDFDVFDIDKMRQHLEARKGFYRDSGSEIKTIRLRK